MALVGYARTSTVDQEAGLQAQLRDLRAAGCEEVYEEKVSSVATERPQLEAAIKWARKGDTFVVTKLDRLARSVMDLLKVVHRLDEKGVRLLILGSNIDTGSPTGRLQLQILGSVAEFERAIMLERQKEGIAKAKSEGKFKGQAPVASRKADDILRLKAEGMTADQIASKLKLGRSSVYRVLKDPETANRIAAGDKSATWAAPASKTVEEAEDV